MRQLDSAEDERQRLEVVRSFSLQDVLPDELLNVYVRHAAAICDSPIALVSIVESERQHFPARFGLDITHTTLRDSFCVHAIQNSNAMLVVADASLDSRFADNPLVNGEPYIRFYAGVPLVTADYVALGTQCVVGLEPRTLDDRAQSALRVLGDAVMISLQEKRRKPWRHEANPFLFEHNPNPMWIYDVETLHFVAVNDAATRQYGYSRQKFLDMTLWDIRPSRDIAALSDRVAQIGHGLAHSKDWKHRKRDGTIIDVTITSEEVRYGDRPALLVLATDITRETQAEAALVHLVHHDPLTGLLNRLGLDRAFCDFARFRYGRSGSLS